jgi:hypothetical protein
MKPCSRWFEERKRRNNHRTPAPRRPVAFPVAPSPDPVPNPPRDTPVLAQRRA